MRNFQKSPRPGAFQSFTAIAFYSALLLVFSAPATVSATEAVEKVTIQGVVYDSSHVVVGDALVHLRSSNGTASREERSNSLGAFAFSELRPGEYQLSAEKDAHHSNSVTIDATSPGAQKHVELILDNSNAIGKVGEDHPETAPDLAVEFADKPNFVVAGVTDWTAVGGHGSDASLRTSESLARETLALKQQSIGSAATNSAANKENFDAEEDKLKRRVLDEPEDFSANESLGVLYFSSGRPKDATVYFQKAHAINPADRDATYHLAQALAVVGRSREAQPLVNDLLAREQTGEAYRLAGEIDEHLGDPLAAVHSLEQAVRLEPSEQNYFEWGSELLLHRAVWQAQEVFSSGAEKYPKSSRMLTALGAALFAGALYDKAAERLCQASDLDPNAIEPYVFMGKVELASPNPLECIKAKLARFVQLHPENALSQYFDAMAILKEQQANEQSIAQAEVLLKHAVADDPKCSDAYLQLGVLAASRHDLARATEYYLQAIEANPQFSDAHYRLAVAYDKLGKPELAKQEFALHDSLEKQQLDEVEAQRREVKQFLIVLTGSDSKDKGSRQR